LFLSQKTKLGLRNSVIIVHRKEYFQESRCLLFSKFSPREGPIKKKNNPLLEAAYIFLLLSLLPALNDDSDVCVLLASPCPLRMMKLVLQIIISNQYLLICGTSPNPQLSLP